MVRISDKQIKELQKILKEQYGLDYSDEEAQTAGLSIMRFTLAKMRRELELKKETDDGTQTAQRPE